MVIYMHMHKIQIAQVDVKSLSDKNPSEKNLPEIVHVNVQFLFNFNEISKIAGS